MDRSLGRLSKASPKPLGYPYILRMFYFEDVLWSILFGNVMLELFLISKIRRMMFGNIFNKIFQKGP